MSILTRNPRTPGPTDRAQRPDSTTRDALPHGYDDPTSPLFVPEHLREHYRVDREAEARRLDAEGARYDAALYALRTRYVNDPAQWRAQLEADFARALPSEVGDRRGWFRRMVDLGPAHYAPPHREDATAIAAALTPEDVELWHHVQRLAEAAKAHRAAEDAAAREAYARRVRICAVCGEHATPVAAYRVDLDAATVEPVAGTSAPGVFRLCAPARAALVARLEARALACEVDGVPLGVLVDRFIDASG